MYLASSYLAVYSSVSRITATKAWERRRLLCHAESTHHPRAEKTERRIAQSQVALG